MKGEKMLLGEFRKKTKELKDNVSLLMLIDEKFIGNKEVQEEIAEPINTLDVDRVNGEKILTLTNGEKGSYSL